jgi:hypothetical protein
MLQASLDCKQKGNSVPVPTEHVGRRKQINSDNCTAVQRKLVRINIEGDVCGRICK